MTALYRGMDKQTLDRAYNNVSDEPNYQEIMRSFKSRSAAVYASNSVVRDLSYGKQPRQRFDWIWCGQPNAPTFVFIHGGYWQNYTKDELAFVATGPLGCGFNVVLAEYTLAPEANMTRIANEIGMILDYLSASRSEIGFGAWPVVLCGHSAGGQLAAIYRAHPAVSLTVSISALFDLEPISLSWLNDKLQLTESETKQFSPIKLSASGSPMIISVGKSELGELIRQSTDYAIRLRQLGEEPTIFTLEEKKHFTVLEDLAESSGVHMSKITTAIAPLLLKARVTTGGTHQRH